MSALEVLVMSVPSRTHCSDLVLAQSGFAHSSMGPCDRRSLPLSVCYYPTYIVLSPGSRTDILPKFSSNPTAQPRLQKQSPADFHLNHTFQGSCMLGLHIISIKTCVLIPDNTPASIGSHGETATTFHY